MALTYAVSTRPAESNYSGTKRLKTFLRSTMRDVDIEGGSDSRNKDNETQIQQ